MSARKSIDELFRMIRVWARRYKILAEDLYIDRRPKCPLMPTNSKRKLSDWPIPAGRQPRCDWESSAIETCRGAIGDGAGGADFLSSAFNWSQSDSTSWLSRGLVTAF
jgi:hypothetical protein